MGLYNFKARFVPLIKRGEKQHTIRAIRANPDKPGNICHLYTGLRTKKTKLIGRYSCVKVEAIEIRRHTRDMRGGGAARLWYTITVEGNQLDTSECESLARRDGFKDFAEMMEFWEGRLPFLGHIVHWRWSKQLKRRNT